VLIVSVVHKQHRVRTTDWVAGIVTTLSTQVEQKEAWPHRTRTFDTCPSRWSNSL